MKSRDLFKSLLHKTHITRGALVVDLVSINLLLIYKCYSQDHNLHITMRAKYSVTKTEVTYIAVIEEKVLL